MEQKNDTYLRFLNVKTQKNGKKTNGLCKEYNTEKVACQVRVMLDSARVLCYTCSVTDKYMRRKGEQHAR